MFSSSFLRRRRVQIASVVVVVAAAGSLVGYAFAAEGFSVHHAPLNDGGVWVSGSNYGEFAHLNKPIGQFDGGVGLGTTTDQQVGDDLDIVQDGAASFGLNRSAGKLAALDGQTMGVSPGQTAAISAGSAVAIGGTSPAVIAVLDPATGSLWATHVDTDQQTADVTPLDRSSKPLAKVGSASAVTVSATGMIFAAAANGDLTTIPATDTGFGRKSVIHLGSFTKAPTVTAVGNQPAVLSGTELYLGSGRVTKLADDSVLQQPGPADPDVLAASPVGLDAITISSGATVKVSGSGGGTNPVAPVRNGTCTYAAWGGATTTYRTACGSTAVNGTVDADAHAALTFRVNREQVVLNDPRGPVWNVDKSKSVEVDDWQAVVPPKPSKGHQNHDHKDLGSEAKPPVAKPDILYARPSRTTILHVLDNDTRPANDVIAISGPPTGLTDPDASLAVSSDEQTIAITLPASTTNPVHFNYSISDVNHPQSVSAPVTVNPVSGGDTAPFLCTCALNTPWSVGVSSVLDIPVIGNWRDKEGDPVTLVSSDAGSVQTSVTSDGDILFSAPDTPPAGGKVTVHYVVSDGFGKTAPGSLTVSVLGVNATTGVKPTAQTDVAQTVVDQTVTLQPLANDLPGADPTTDDPTLQLTAVGQVAGATVTPDLVHGLVNFSSKIAKTYLIPYSVSYGIESSSGVMRVDVRHSSRTDNDVVALPDTAVLHGQETSTVDLLANDYDRQGGLLVVQNATATKPDSSLQMSVVQGRFLHISLGNSAPSAQPEDVTYTVTDGADTATGHVSVVELPVGQADLPVALPDAADVRTGDSVSVPVLDNDLDPAGSPLTITTGSVTTPQGGGEAFQVGNTVRYIAPAGIKQTTSATFQYVVTNGDHNTTGTATVTIHPAPATLAADAPPAPLPIVGSVVAGGSVVVNIPTSGVDPDGDSVSFAGITDPGPHLGSITATTADTITYQAFPAQNNVGTDVIGYRVTDSFGLVGDSQIRIAVVAPGAAQPPVAVDDAVQGAPGAKLAVNVVANDLVAPGDVAHISIGGDAHGATTVDPTNPDVIDVTAPGAGAQTSITYLLSDGSGGAPDPATLTVTGVTGWDNPPVAQDDFAKPSKVGTARTSVDVLTNDYDPDRSDQLSVVKVFRAAATFTGSTVTIPLASSPQVVPYEISDGKKTAVAVVYVPAVGAGAPYVDPGKFIQVPENTSTKTLNINSYLTDPAGKQLITTFQNNQSASPAGGLQIDSSRGASLVLAGAGHYVGPASITLEVTDGATPTAKGATTGYVTIPVQVGLPTPLLRCPTGYTRDIYQGGSADSFNVAAVCHLWLPQGATARTVNLTSSWKTQPRGVAQTLDPASHVLTVIPSRDAHAGETGSITLGVAKSAQRQTINYRVSALPPLQLAPITASGRNAKPTTVDISSHAQTAIQEPKFAVTACTRTGGLQATCTPKGDQVVITPADSARGAITFAVTLTDVPGDKTRQVTGTVTMNVIGRPAPPTAVRADANRTAGGTVRLTWNDPAYSGGPGADYIAYYDVAYAGGDKHCLASGCLITGLTDGRAYVFTVTTVNKANQRSSSSARSTPATPDTRPNQVRGLAARVADGRIVLSWARPAAKGSAIKGYDVQYSDVGTKRPGDRGVHAVTGLSLSAATVNDDPYQFKVRAKNADGAGSWSAVLKAQSAGVPASVTGVQVPAESSTVPSDQVYVAVTWSKGSDPNGGPLAHYTVYRRTAGGQAEVLPNCKAISANAAPECQDSVKNDGTQYQYGVTATNSSVPSGASKESRITQWADFDATGVPNQVTGLKVFAGQGELTSGTPDPGVSGGSGAGFDRSLKVSFTVPKPNGGSVVAIQYQLDGGSWATLSGAGPLTTGATATGTIGDLTNGQGYGVALRALNSKNAGPASTTAPDEYPYGNPNIPTATATHSGTQVTYMWSGSTNGRPIDIYVNIDNTSYVDKGSQPGSMTVDRGYDASYSISAYVKDTAGQQSGNSASTPNSGQTDDVPPPNGGNCNGSNGTTLVYNWNAPASVLSYDYNFNGQGWTDNGTSTSVSKGGLQYSTTYGIDIRSKDGSGHVSGVYSFTCATGPAPIITSITAHKEGKEVVSHGSSTCTHAPGCYALGFELHNFATGSFSYSCLENNSDYYDSTIRITDPNESFDGDGYCVDNNSGVTVSIRINGYEGSANF